MLELELQSVIWLFGWSLNSNLDKLVVSNFIVSLVTIIAVTIV